MTKTPQAVRTVGIVTFANLGRKHNLKTPDILPVIETFKRSGELNQVICQINAGYDFKTTKEAPPALVRLGLRLVERIVGLSLPRQALEVLFDWYASRLLVASDTYIFHAGYSLPRTFRKARMLGGVIIDLTVTAHLATNAALEKEELRRLGILEFTGFYTRLSRKKKHVDTFDYAIAISNFVRESYVASGFSKERIFVAHPDIDLARFTPGEERTGTFRVLYVAYTTPLKGLHYLLTAWEQLGLVDAELVLVGGYGEMPESLREQYAKRALALGNVRLESSTLAPELQYREASVFAFPSLSEGFGRVTLEAMACGLPVVTTENAAGLVVDGVTGFVVPIRDADALAQRIRYLYEHPGEAVRMGREGRKAVETKPAFGDAIYAIYRDIMRREGTL